MFRTWRMALVIVAAGCGTGPTGGAKVKDLVMGGCADEGRLAAPTAADTDGGDSGAPESLVVTAGAAGSIDVVHEHVSGTCCVDFKIKPTVSGHTLTITYTETGTPCDCMCRYDFQYTVEGLEAGDWTVSAGTSTASVTVD